MDESRDNIALTVEERRALAALEDRAGRDDPKLGLSLTAGSRRTRLHSRRVLDSAAAGAFLAGGVLLIATFGRWPIVGIAGLVVEVIALWVLLARWAPIVAAGMQRWNGERQPPGGSTDRSARR